MVSPVFLPGLASVIYWRTAQSISIEVALDVKHDMCSLFVFEVKRCSISDATVERAPKILLHRFHNSLLTARCHSMFLHCSLCCGCISPLSFEGLLPRVSKSPQRFSIVIVAEFLEASQPHHTCVLLCTCWFRLFVRRTAGCRLSRLLSFSRKCKGLDFPNLSWLP